jgi:hypothetical protein
MRSTGAVFFLITKTSSFTTNKIGVLVVIFRTIVAITFTVLGYIALA